jgi:ankyrin repeat protein
MLLDKGADVNGQGEYSNALYAASRDGHKKVVQMLLDKGADVNAQVGYDGNPLYAVSTGGHENVVQMLLDRGGRRQCSRIIRRWCRCFLTGGPMSMLKEENIAMPYAQHQQMATRRWCRHYSGC